MTKLSAFSPRNFCPLDLAGAGLFVALTLAFAFGLIAPLGVRERLHAARVQAVVRQKQHAAALAAEVRTVNARITTQTTRLAESPLKIRSPDALNERLANLVALTDECGLRMQELKPGDGAAVRRYFVLPIHLAGQGGYPDTAHFLRRLHERLPDVGVRSFKLAAAPEGGARCELELRWFASPQTTSTKVETAAVSLR